MSILHKLFVGWSSLLVVVAVLLTPVGALAGEGTLGKSSTTVAAVDNLVNVNKADAEELQKVKWIGKKRAEAIVAYRKQHGSFQTLADLLKIKSHGINKKWLEKVSKFLTL